MELLVKDHAPRERPCSPRLNSPPSTDDCSETKDSEGEIFGGTFRERPRSTRETSPRLNPQLALVTAVKPFAKDHAPPERPALG